MVSLSTIYSSAINTRDKLDWLLKAVQLNCCPAKKVLDTFDRMFFGMEFILVNSRPEIDVVSRWISIYLRPVSDWTLSIDKVLLRFRDHEVSPRAALLVPYQTLLQNPEIPIISVADPNPDPPNPHVFGPPGSGSTSQGYGSGSGSCSGSGSGSFYHHAKIVRKTLLPTILGLLLTFYISLKKDVNVASKSSFLLASWRWMTKIAGSGSGSISQRHGSADPGPDLDSPQNVMDPQHCL